MASIQKYKTPKGVIRYRVMWRDESKQRSKSFDRWKTANDYKTKLEHDQRSGVYVEPVRMTLENYLSEWIIIHESGLAYRTASDYKANIKVHINPNIGNIVLQKVNSGHIEVFLKSLVKKGIVRTAQISYNILNVSLKAAVRKKYIAINPCDAINKPKYTPKRVAKLLQPEEINPYVSFFEDTWCYIAIILGVTTGMRRGELAALRWKDINYSKQEININASIYIENGQRKRKVPKSKKTRTVYMSDTLMHLLKQQRKRQKINQVRFGQEYKQ